MHSSPATLCRIDSDIIATVRHSVAVEKKYLDCYKILWDTMPYEKNNENKTHQKL